MRVGNILRSAALLLAGLTLSGCIHFTHESAEGKPVSDIATINQINPALTIVRVDGEGTWFWLSRQSQYFIGPGIHRIEVRRELSQQSYTGTVERTVELAAGRTYGLDGKTGYGRWDFEVRDIETGQRVDKPVPETAAQ
ncbi:MULTISPECIES: hypothetical protein [Pseudomonas]|jgi:hypothetical protein|uniref:Lipoprotein n=2 Tax=Pseudomonas TaxID=286 RepID=A0A4Y8VH32_9PSED|nr:MULTISPECIES: hypothetical protein [Pseudomonas]TFH78873.1 hypothetical protein E4J90_19225 [Pseudomonas kribbensis]